MDAKTFRDTFGKQEAETVAKEAGTNIAYFEQIMYRARKPSPQLAIRLELASGGRMTRSALRPDIFGDQAELSA